jgi:steroid 5-alpha reductase family enzyme
MASLLAITLATAVALMVVVWVGSVVLRDVSIVDRFWGLGFVLLAWVAYVLTDTDTTRRLLVVGLVSLWGVRLSVHITWRNWGKGEDYRYRDMRDKRGATFPLSSLFTVFLLQALILWVVAAPVVQVQRASQPAGLTWLDVLGVAVFGIGFLFETVGDWQLARFKSDPSNRGKVLDSGLWRYTRHPNYFGDAMVWWGFFLFALATSGWWTIYGPIIMTALLMKVSGVALLERSLKETKPGYREYVERTNAFFPWPPQKA